MDATAFKLLESKRRFKAQTTEIAKRRAGADHEAIECCMFQIVDALAAVEGICEKDLQGLFWERRRLSPTEQCVTLRRKFSDPDYPRKFDVAFRRLTGHFDPIRLH
jgi:hypothetical protein